MRLGGCVVCGGGYWRWTRWCVRGVVGGSGCEVMCVGGGWWVVGGGWWCVLDVGERVRVRGGRGRWAVVGGGGRLCVCVWCVVCGGGCWSWVWWVLAGGGGWWSGVSLSLFLVEQYMVVSKQQYPGSMVLYPRVVLVRSLKGQNMLQP